MLENKMCAAVKKKRDLPLRICDCGVGEYKNILDRQFQLRDDRRLGKICNTVLIVEHPAVITLGARESANKLLADVEGLKSKQIDVVAIRRGGGVTAHNLGQLVFYPVLNIQELGLGINEYIRELEAIGIELLDWLGVTSERQKGFPGLWAGEKKIASVGVRVSKFVTYHGMAINIQNELDIFKFFVPCGLDGVVMTSASKECGKSWEMEEVKEKLGQLLGEHFSSEGLVEYEK